MKRGFFILSVLALAVVGLLFWPGSGRDYVELDVVQGSTAYRVGQELQERGLIKLIHPFLAWTKIRGAGSKLKIGRYRFSRGRAAFWIVDDLINGRTQKVKIVIPEGFASWQVAERLGELKICDEKEFLKVVKAKGLEGYMFPATYELDIGYSPESVANVFKQTFDQKWTADMDAQARAMKMEKQDVVTLASIIQREVMVLEELPIVSSVYHNRLKRNMPLQADPTVQYALGFWKQRLFYTDYRNVKSPYNTYLNTGLPPGPICNPGLPAIQAALEPAKTDFLYFVAAENGHHTFSTDYRQHTNKVNKRNKKK